MNRSPSWSTTSASRVPRSPASGIILFGCFSSPWPLRPSTSRQTHNSSVLPGCIRSVRRHLPAQSFVTLRSARRRAQASGPSLVLWNSVPTESEGDSAGGFQRKQLLFRVHLQHCSLWICCSTLQSRWQRHWNKVAFHIGSMLSRCDSIPLVLLPAVGRDS